MSTDQIDYEAVLADLRAKRDKLDAAIAGIETMLGIRGLSASADAASQAGGKPSNGGDLGAALRASALRSSGVSSSIRRLPPFSPPWRDALTAGWEATSEGSTTSPTDKSTISFAS